MMQIKTTCSLVLLTAASALAWAPAIFPSKVSMRSSHARNGAKSLHRRNWSLSSQHLEEYDPLGFSSGSPVIDNHSSENIHTRALLIATSAVVVNYPSAASADDTATPDAIPKEPPTAAASTDAMNPKAIPDAIPKTAPEVAPIVKDTASVATSAPKAIPDGVPDAASTAAAASTAPKVAPAEVVSDAASTAAVTTSKVVPDAIPETVRAAADVVAQTAPKPPDAVRPSAVDISMPKIPTEIPEAIRSATSAVSDVPKTISKALVDFSHTLSDTISGASGTLSGATSSVTGTLSDAKSSVAATVNGVVPNDALSAVSAVYDRYLSGVVAGFAAFVEEFFQGEIACSMAAYGHFLSIMAISACVVAERVLIKPNMSVEDEDRVAVVDAALGAFGILLLYTGYIRVIEYGRGWEFYSHEPTFWLKISLVGIFGAQSFFNTIQIFQRAVERRTKGGIAPMSDKLAERMIQVCNAEIVALVSIPLTASMMARGIGYSESIPWEAGAGVSGVVFLALSYMYIKESLTWNEEVFLMSTAFRPGTQVVLVDLMSRPELNGRPGVVVSGVSRSGRIQIRLDGQDPKARPVAVRPDNLRVTNSFQSDYLY